MRAEGRPARAMVRRCLPRRWTGGSRSSNCGDRPNSDGSNGVTRSLAEPPSDELRERLEGALHDMLDQGAAVEDRWKVSRADAGLSAQGVGLLTEWVAALRDASLGMERALLDINLGETPSPGVESDAKPAPTG